MYKETCNELCKFNNDLWSVIYSLPNTLQVSFNKLYKFLLALEPIKLKIFIDTNLYTLKNIHRELIILLKENKHVKSYHNIDPKLLRSMFDKLFIKLINISHENNATLIFKEFIKGITYFSYQDSGYIKEPVYHRLFSCGDGKWSFRNTFNRCTVKKNRNDVSKRIKTCFLERSIYENIYIKYLNNSNASYTKKTQDKAHTEWLKQTKNDFNTCFPGLYVKIKIKYTGLYPIYLLVMWHLDGKIVYIEEYFKNIISFHENIMYEKNVLVIKRNKNKTYTTKTTFESKNIKFSKKDENNTLFFKLLEKDNVDFREEYAKEYFVENNFDFNFNFNFDLFLFK